MYQLTAYAFANQEKIDQIYLFYPVSTMIVDNYYLKNRYGDTEINIISKGLNLDTLIVNIEYDNFVTEIFK